ncbi:MAG TPA: tyrosine-type recombinase/integrase [Candidatus Limnocylindrales bacterium]|nr:tyrosine-type recombinase/integrase [Candidatus Limnocylindrales bacterium]
MKKNRAMLKALNSYDQAALLKQPNPKVPTGLRNLCVISLMLRAGLRVNEIIDLKISDVNWLNGRLRVKESRGAKDRVLLLGEAEMELLERWRQKRPSDEPYLFTTLDGNKLKDRYIREMVKRLARKAGIGKDVYPRLLRHTFAADLMRETKDIRLLQRALGHRDLAATQIYTKLLYEEFQNVRSSYDDSQRCGIPIEEEMLEQVSIQERDDVVPTMALQAAEPHVNENQVEAIMEPQVTELQTEEIHAEELKGEEQKAEELHDEDLKAEKKPIENTQVEERLTAPEGAAQLWEPIPKITIFAENNFSDRQPENMKEDNKKIAIPAIKCSNCEYILRFQGDCPKCGTEFIAILRHWGRNV